MLSQKIQKWKLTVLGAVWHCKPTLVSHLCSEGVSEPLGTALHAAVLRADVELLRQLCGRGEMSATWSGATALDLAVAKGFEEGGELLLQHNAPLWHYRNESLLEAVERGSALLLRALLLQMRIYSHTAFLMESAAKAKGSCFLPGAVWPGGFEPCWARWQHVGSLSSADLSWLRGHCTWPAACPTGRRPRKPRSASISAGAGEDFGVSQCRSAPPARFLHLFRGPDV